MRSRPCFSDWRDAIWPMLLLKIMLRLENYNKTLLQKEGGMSFNLEMA